MRRIQNVGLYAAVLALVLMGNAALRAQATDGNGLIVAEQWLALGPFQTPIACDGNPGITGLYANHIGPGTHIACQTPQLEDVIEFYDPSDPDNPTNGLTEIPGINVDDGMPMWWAFDDGSPTDGDLNLDGTELGDMGQHVMFLATYIEYLGEEPIVVDFCHGTDDDGQVWIDDRLVQNQLDCSGLSDCEYTFKALIRPGQHVIKMGVWEEGGGWQARLSMRVDGQPIVDGDPDWVFLGHEGEVELPDCEPDQFFVYDPPERVGCENNEDGSVTLTWANHADTDPDGEIRILVNGEVSATLPAGTESHTVPAAEADGAEIFCVESASGLQSCLSCSAAMTDANGNILSAGWLIFGPFNRAIAGCPSNPDDLVRNTIPPSRIDCLYPEEGDEIEYEEFEPASSTTGLLDLGFNVGGDGLPLVHRFNDGSNTNDSLSLDGHFGDQGNMVAWMITYVEYVGNSDTTIDICHGTDDDGQIWFNNILVGNQPDCSGAPDCEYPIRGVPIAAGTVYRVAVGVWETGGGWDLRFRMEDSATGIPIAEGDPDWVFHGREKPADFEAPECAECDLVPVTNLTCELRTVGFGTGLVLNWDNPPVMDPAIPTRILVNGQEVATVATDATTATILSGALPDGNYSVQVIHCGGVPATCTPFKTDDAGNILGGGWLIFGPFSRLLAGCPSSEVDMLQNTIPPSNIACVYPEEGEEIEYEEFDPTSSTSGLVDLGFNVGADGPLVHPFDDGNNTDDDHDLDDHFGGDQGNAVAWMTTYVEYVGDSDTEVDICLGTDDDAQIWFNDTLVATQPDCSGPSDCEYRVSLVPIAAETVYRIAVGVWETGGGWNLRFRMEDSATGLPIVDGDPDWVFHGAEKPEGFEGSCPDCSAPVANLTCSRNPDGSVSVSWENPEGCEEDIVISAAGQEVAVVAADESEVTIAAADMPFDGAVSVSNGSTATVSCSTIEATEFHTDLAFVSAWLHLGPFAQQDGAAPGCDLIEMDHLTDGETTELEIEPKAGDQIETDFGGAAASLGLNPAEVCPECNLDGIPTWEGFTNTGDLFDVNSRISAGDNQMSYGMFYLNVTNDVTVDIGVASDDSIQVLAAPVGDDLISIHCNSVGRGSGGANTVQDVIPDVELSQGPWKFMVKVFEGGGGHNWRLQFLKGGLPILPGEISLEPGEGGGPGASLRPGDVNADGSFNIADMVAQLNFLFGGASLPGCYVVPGSDPVAVNATGLAILDYNGDGSNNIADPVAGLGGLFGGGAPHALGEGCATVEGDCADNCTE